MDNVEHVIFYTKTPEGPDYLSISLLGPNGLIERRVFSVVGEELDHTPHIEGMETKRIFIPQNFTQPVETTQRGQ